MNNFEEAQKIKLTIDLSKANIVSFLILIPAILFFVLPFYFIWHEEINAVDFINSVKTSSLGIIGTSLLCFFVLIAGIVVHELIHGLVWALFAPSHFKSIRFGVMWRALAAYCHCTEPMKIKHYILGGIMPAVVLGFLPAILALITGNIWLLFFGILFIVSACGDFMILYLLRNENRNDMVQDHPSEPGCYVYRKRK